MKLMAYMVSCMLPDAARFLRDCAHASSRKRGPNNPSILSVYIYIYLCIQACTYVHTHTYTYMFLCVSVCMRMVNIVVVIVFQQGAS